MKSPILFKVLIVIALLIAACSKKNSLPDKSVEPYDITTVMSNNYNAGADSPFVTKDSANKMLTSYLNSIASTEHQNELRALIFDAEALRYYLEDTTIKNFKIMFAHRLDYINEGSANIYAGNSIDAITMIIVGVNSAGNYVYSPAGTAVDNAIPCPSNCPSGNAGSNLLVN